MTDSSGLQFASSHPVFTVTGFYYYILAAEPSIFFRAWLACENTAGFNIFPRGTPLDSVISVVMKTHGHGESSEKKKHPAKIQVDRKSTWDFSWLFFDIILVQACNALRKLCNPIPEHILVQDSTHHKWYTPFLFKSWQKKPLQQSRLLRNPLDIKKKYFQVCRRFWKIILFTVTILPKDTRLAWDFWVGARDDTSSKGKIVFTTGWPYLAEVTLSGWSVHHHLPHWISVKWPGIFDKWLWGFCSITSSHRTSRKSSWIPNLLGDGI